MMATHLQHKMGRMVLIVNKDPLCWIALENVLRRAGHEIHGAETREEARAKVCAFAYDLVLLDNCLSGGDDSHDGLDILCSIRSRSRASKVILTAGNGSPMLAAAALELGAASYLEKPVPLTTILEEMERCGVGCSGSGEC
jgi:DNA-binding NtrC family response regulator